LEAPAKDNSIESTFATIRHRTIRSKGCLSSNTALAMMQRVEPRALCILALILYRFQAVSGIISNWILIRIAGGFTETGGLARL